MTYCNFIKLRFKSKKQLITNNNKEMITCFVCKKYLSANIKNNMYAQAHIWAKQPVGFNFFSKL